MICDFIIISNSNLKNIIASFSNDVDTITFELTRTYQKSKVSLVLSCIDSCKTEIVQVNLGSVSLKHMESNNYKFILECQKVKYIFSEIDEKQHFLRIFVDEKYGNNVIFQNWHDKYICKLPMIDLEDSQNINIKDDKCDVAIEIATEMISQICDDISSFKNDDLLDMTCDKNGIKIIKYFENVAYSRIYKSKDIGYDYQTKFTIFRIDDETKLAKGILSKRSLYKLKQYCDIFALAVFRVKNDSCLSVTFEDPEYGSNTESLFLAIPCYQRYKNIIPIEEKK